MASLIEHCPVCDEVLEDCNCFKYFEFQEFIESLPAWLGTDITIIQYLREAYELGLEDRQEE